MKAKRKIPLSVINKMSKDQFVGVLGGVFELAPWVAENAWMQRPFFSWKQLHERMMEAVRQAPGEQVAALLNGHPELGTKIETTACSLSEQRNDGPAQLLDNELAHFAAYNRDYRERFGFPFILSVKGKAKSEIFAAMNVRIHNSAATELEIAIGEVGKIAAARLEELLEA